LICQDLLQVLVLAQHCLLKTLVKLPNNNI
jgi:hypothetical protein